MTPRAQLRLGNKRNIYCTLLRFGGYAAALLGQQRTDTFWTYSTCPAWHRFCRWSWSAPTPPDSGVTQPALHRYHFHTKLFTCLLIGLLANKLLGGESSSSAFMRPTPSTGCNRQTLAQHSQEFRVPPKQSATKAECPLYLALFLQNCFGYFWLVTFPYTFHPSLSSHTHTPQLPGLFGTALYR